MKRILSVFAFGALLGAPAFAGLLYTNGPLSGTIEGRTISSPVAVSNSFTTTGGTATSFDFGSWNWPGEVTTSVDWAVGTTAFGSEIASGTAALANTFQFHNSNRHYDIFVNTGALPNIVLAPGGYWFTLQNAQRSGFNPVYWDVNDGLSTALQSLAGGTPAGIRSETFNIYADATATPEPGSMLLLGCGMLAIAGRLHRKILV